MPYKHRLRYIAYRWCSALLCIVALVLQPAPASSGERPQLTLRLGPGEKYAVAATVPTASRMEFTILDEHGEWVKVRLWSGQEGWLRLEILQAASRAPAAGPTRPLDPAPLSATPPPTRVLPDRAPEPAPLSTSVTLAGERPQLTLRSGPGEKYAVAATVPTASRMEFTILEDHGEWSKVRVLGGQEGWLRLGTPQVASRAPAAGPTRPLDPAPLSTTAPPTKVLPDRAPEPAPLSPSAASRSPAAGPTRPLDPAPLSTTPSPTKVLPDRTPEPAPLSTSVTLAGERPQLTLRSGPGEEYAVAATVPTASRMEFTILEDHGEWSKVRVLGGQEGWLRLGPPQAASRAPAAGPTRPLDPAPLSATPPPTKVLPDRAPEPAPLSTSAASRAPAAGTDRPPDSAPVSVATPPTKALPDRSPEPALSSTSTPLAQETISRLPEQRTALVIGNAAYEREIGNLQNPVNDAEDVAAALRQLNFQVTLLPNASYEQMEKAVRAFHEQLRRHNGVGLFYFAGHGAELDGIGYLIPLRSGLRDRWELPYKALNVRYIQTAMGEAGNRLNIIILNTSREIPVFEASERKLRGRGSSPQRGLPPIIAEPDSSLPMPQAPGKLLWMVGRTTVTGSTRSIFSVLLLFLV